MNKIKQIKLKYFKFFYGEVTIDLERQNSLIFGENGSGKSSLYWALYTFLQSVFKDTPQKVWQDTLIKMYEGCYNSSDKTKNADFWEEIVITSTGQLLKTERKF
jgi:AAA15 family ATPase/GTPase